MTKINLLPPEIIERRKTEKLFIYFISAGLLIVLILIFIFSIFSFQEARVRSELNQIISENKKIEVSIQDLQVYEERKKEWEAYENIFKSAIEDEISWSKIINSLSMVIPSDTWITEFDGSFEGGINAKGQTPYYEDIEHKPVARFLIRMSEISELTEVWLSFSRITPESQDKLGVVDFEVTGKLEKAYKKEMEQEQQKQQTPAPAPPSQ